ncbi:hypothetical protein [Yoonia sp.]|uniref:hypothetical protein n=1 Tax=Yoonia sp. TaxID=2212373 RepID=UPI0019E5FEF3|nr:hypothetical protein [Yoonia sp.]MBE0412619.1 hypothetical protein [Yoonia sp.]
MTQYHKRLTVAEIRALKGKRQLTMHYVDKPEEAAAAAAAGIDDAVDHWPAVER